MRSRPTRLERVTGRLREELAKTSRHPGRILNLLRAGDRAMFLHSLRAGVWEADGEFERRHYDGYAEYLEHQAAKPVIGDVTEHDRVLRSSLADRLVRDELVQPGSAVLCLGARSGAEVMAFLDRGCFAVGIDIKPGARNEHVLFGDFQHIAFPTASVDVVYTNSLDHAFDVNAVRDEIVRVLRPGGIAIVEAVRGTDEGHPPGFYEAFYWHTTDDLVGMLTVPPLTLEKRYPFADPWPGEHIVLVREPRITGETKRPTSSSTT